MIKNKSRIIYFIILIIGLFLRLYRIADAPSRPTIDEMSIGYNAFSLIQTGKDEWGASWPLIFRAFGDYKLPLYIYGTIPFVWLFDLQIVSVRLLSVIAGMVIVLSVGILVQQLLRHKWAGYMAAFLISVSPWPVFISRMGLESNVGLALFSVALIFLVKIFRQESKRYALIVGLLFGLSWYAYIAFRLITGLFAVGLVFYSLRFPLWRPYVLRMIITFVLCLLPLIHSILDFSGQARFQQISIFSDIGFTSEINEDRSFCYLQNPTFLPQLCSVFFNKPLSWSLAFISNYLQVFSPSFLFIDGGILEYLSVPGFGEFFVILLPFYFVGIWWWCRQKEIIFRILGFLWIVSPIASALTGPAHVVRASAVIPFITLAIVFGFRYVWDKILKSKYLPILSLGFSLVFIVLACRYFLNYFFVYPAQFDSASYPLPPALGTYIEDKSKHYQKIYFSPIGPGLHMFIAYYLKYPPDQYRRDVVWPVPDEIGFTHPHILGKYEFNTSTIEDVFNSSESGVLFVGLQSDIHQPTFTFNNFLGIHPQAMVYDVDEIKAKELLDSQTVPK